MIFPKISILIPTLNAASVLEKCLQSIAVQDYPRDKLEIIIGDGGSVDETLSIARKYNAIVVENKLKTGEAGKAVALKYATGDYIALIDSDNILPNTMWLQEMVSPLQEQPEAVGSEPWEYTWRKQDSFITRYSALIGMNDPLVLFLGNYDRLNLLAGKWTETPHEEQDCGGYLVVAFDKRGIPTIGANGTVFRTEFIKENVKADYLFDIDVLASFVQNNGSVTFIKVKNGIIHTFCEGNILKFAKKQRRRVRDYVYHRNTNAREYKWDGPGMGIGLLKFVLSCVFFIPLLLQALKGYLKKPDLAWFFHPLACYITLWEYGWGMLLGTFNKSELSRSNWKQ